MCHTNLTKCTTEQLTPLSSVAQLEKGLHEAYADATKKQGVGGSVISVKQSQSAK